MADMGTLKRILSFWRAFILVVTPIALMPLPLVIQTEPARVGYVVLLMAVYWITEALPTAVTALMPALAFPMLGVIPAKEISPFYFKDTNVMLVGSMIVAIAIENSNLHKRMALRMMLFFGTKPRWLMLGFMFPTWFLSMWILNTATTAMMMPVAVAVLDELRHFVIDDGSSAGQDNKAFTETDGDIEINGDIELKSIQENITPSHDGTEHDANNVNVEFRTAPSNGNMTRKEYKNLGKAMSLCIAYSANIGGTASLTGTGPNLIMKGQADIVFNEHGMATSGVNFSSWMVFGLPGAVIALLAAWAWLQIFFLGTKCFSQESNKEREERLKAVIRKEYDKMGNVSFAEKITLVHFVVLVLLWLTRKPEFIPGWGDVLKHGYVTDATSTLLIVMLLFSMPSEIPKMNCCSSTQGAGPVPPLITWKIVRDRLPWGVVLLLGGGFALAEACTRSKLSAWLGEQMTFFQHFPGWAMVMILVALAAGSTEITSNSAMATLLMPVMANMAENLGTNPLYLMFPVTIATSFAFMLPVATPPNALVYGYGLITIPDMMKAGIVMNCICILIVTLATETWGMAFFKLNTIPWANGTALATPVP